MKDGWRVTPAELARIRAATDHVRTDLVFRCLRLTSWLQKAEDLSFSEDPKLRAAGMEYSMRLEQVGFGTVPLNTPTVKAAVLDAAERNDRDFFVWFGRIIKTDWMKEVSENLKFSKSGGKLLLPFFLLEHWDRPADGLPEFLYLTKKGVADVCSVVLREDWAEGTIRRRCKRLGLLSSTGRKIQVMRKDVTLTFLPPDGQEFVWPSPSEGR